MISRYYHTPDGERCRLYAVRPKDVLEAEHPGCLRVCLQPIECGIVLAERGVELGWFTPEAIEDYHQHFLAQGWECSGEKPRPYSGPRVALLAKIETRLECLNRLIASGANLKRTSSTRYAIRVLCRQAGVPIPAIAA